jgi:tryptophanyl-tRNA synthetase
MPIDTILTGDRPSGPLHLGHYVGSLQNRVKLQESCKQYIIIADLQAMTDNWQHPEKLKENVYQVMLDYLAVGIDPKKSTIFIQSMIPQLPELTMYYMNLVTVARVGRNPTVKTEITQKGFGESTPLGFFVYPVSQAADITAFKANIVPVGEDQIPMIEQTNEIVRAFNRTYNTQTLVECKAVVPKHSRLPGIDGKAKMSKSLGNAIYLSDSLDALSKKVMGMYTDPEHVRVSDPGKIEGNVVFSYLDVFDPNTQEVEQLKEHYQKGGLGDVVLKKRLIAVLDALLSPIRLRRDQFAQDRDQVMKLVLEGTAQAEAVAAQTLHDAKEAMKIIYR